MWNMLMHKVSQMHNGVRMAFHGTMLMLVWSVHALDVARRVFAAQGACASGTGSSAAGGIDRECRAALEKLCTGH